MIKSCFPFIRIFLFLSIIFDFSSNAVFARIEILPPLKVESEISAWNESLLKRAWAMRDGFNYTYPDEGYTECRRLIEVEDTFLCLSHQDVEMNSSFLRCSFFVEGLYNSASKDKVIRQDDPTYKISYTNVAGHNLQRRDLLEFNRKIQEDCVSSNKDKMVCYNRNEKEMFENFIVPYAIQIPKFVVISAAQISTMKWQYVVSHEIMHAQYFNHAKYKDTVDAVWEKQMTEEEKEEIRNALSGVYDKSNEFLMKNEFQAYILQTGAENARLSTYVAKYRPLFLKRFKEAGVIPIQMEEVK